VDVGERSASIVSEATALDLPFLSDQPDPECRQHGGRQDHRDQEQDDLTSVR